MLASATMPNDQRDITQWPQAYIISLARQNSVFLVGIEGNVIFLYTHRVTRKSL